MNHKNGLIVLSIAVVGVLGITQLAGLHAPQQPVSGLQLELDEVEQLQAEVTALQKAAAELREQLLNEALIKQNLGE